MAGTNIVTVNVSQQVAPTPSTLQQTGAFISQGGTNTSPGTITLLTQLSDLTPHLNTAKALTSLAWASNVVTATTTSPHGFTVGDTLYITIAGAVPTGYNGTFLATVTTTTAFTYPLTTSPGTETTPGTYIPTSANVITQMATTFFAQGSATAVYVLELGPGNATDGVTALSNWITANPGVFYAYLVPRIWDGNANFLSFLANFESTTAKTYFFVTTTLATYQNYTSQMKDVVAMIEAPQFGAWSANALTAITWASNQVTATTTTAHGVAVGQWFQISGVTPAGYNGWFQAQAGTTGTTLVYNLATNPGTETVLGTLVANYYSSTGVAAGEFSLASEFWVTLNENPSSTNKVGPLEFTYVYGVTPFLTQGTVALLSTLASANINYIGTAISGGVTNTLIAGGNTMDGNPWNYWYSVDWVQINVALNCNNAVINGSNNPINPLYLNQDGINRIQSVGASTLNSAVQFGLALGQVVQTELNASDFQNNLNAGTYAGQVVINAVPFSSYYALSPGDYKIGKYAGYTVVYAPQRGFQSIVFDVIVTNFVAA